MHPWMHLIDASGGLCIQHGAQRADPQLILLWGAEVGKNAISDLAFQHLRRPDFPGCEGDRQLCQDGEGRARFQHDWVTILSRFTIATGAQRWDGSPDVFNWSTRGA